jgi:hypothetical protein
MVGAAQQDGVVQGRAPTIDPVLDVVRVAPACRAAREPAPPVACRERPPQRRWNGSPPVSLFPSGNGRLSLLSGTYALESQAVVLLDFIGPGAIEATGTGILDFQITSTPVPEPATWTLMLACVGALGARRMRGRICLRTARARRIRPWASNECTR